MLFLQSVLTGLSVLGRWDVLLVAIAYGVFHAAVTLAPLILFGSEGASRQEETFSGTFNLALIRAIGASLASACLVGLLLGAPGLELAGEVARGSWLTIVSCAALAFIAGVGLLQHRGIGKMLAESSLLPCIAGILMAARLAGAFVPLLAPQAPATPLPGLLLTLGYLLIGEILSRLLFIGIVLAGGMLTGHRDQELMDMPFSIWVFALVVLGLAATTPVLMYLAYIRLALAHPAGWL